MTIDQEDVTLGLIEELSCQPNDDPDLIECNQAALAELEATLTGAAVPNWLQERFEDAGVA